MAKRLSSNITRFGKNDSLIDRSLLQLKNLQKGILMDFDTKVAIERVQSESVRAVFSIQDHRSIETSYFDRFREAVQAAILFFENEPTVPMLLIDELKNASQVIRNEALVFAGRTVACNEMAIWLDEIRINLETKSHRQ